MKHKRLLRLFIVLMVVFIILPLSATSAYAKTDEDEDIDLSEILVPVISIPEPPPDPMPLTPSGNLTLVDDFSGETARDKQFMTVVSKNGNYFYIIIDRAGMMRMCIS